VGWGGNIHVTLIMRVGLGGGGMLTYMRFKNVVRPAGQNPTIQYLDINGSWTSAALSSVSVKKPVSSGHLRTSARLPEWPAISTEIFQAYGLELAQKLVSRLSSGVAKSITAADFPDLCAEPGGADQLTHQGSRRFCRPLRAFHTCVCQ